MLIIYGSLGIGGVETFFLRIAKHRFQNGMKTTFLFYHPEKNNPKLLAEVEKYASILSLSDVSDLHYLSKYFKLSTPLNYKKVHCILNGVKQVHVFKGEDALLGYKMLNLIDVKIPITVGFYHYVHFLWGGKNIPFFEKINRKFVLEYLPKDMLMLFSKDNINLYHEHTNDDFSKSNVFSIGVLDNLYKPCYLIKKRDAIKLCSVGRLVDFKTYNITIIDTMRKLIDNGYDVTLDIYGDGPLKEKMIQKIKNLNLQNHIKLQGKLEYSNFDDTIKNYDLFIGTGTSIVQSSSLSIPSITALDNIHEPLSYGFFCSVHDRQYGRNNLPIKLIDFYDLIVNYFNMTLDEINDLRLKHNCCVRGFGIENSVKAMEELSYKCLPENKFIFNSYIYDLSRLFHYVRILLDKKYRTLRHTLPSRNNSV